MEGGLPTPSGAGNKIQTLRLPKFKLWTLVQVFVDDLRRHASLHFTGEVKTDEGITLRR
jgi:hypothetical protein